MFDTWPEQKRFMRSLKGAAASILLTLLISGRALTAEELEGATNYSDKPIQKGLDLLESEGLIQNNGKFNGWSLTSGIYQLPIPFHTLSAGMALLDAGENDGRHAALPGGRGEGFTGSETRNNSEFLSSSSSLKRDQRVITTEEEDEEERRRISEIRGLLVGAGVGVRSPALSKLLEMDLDPAYVRAHVEHRRIALEQGKEFPASWLINKLRCGDPAPVVRSSHKQRIPDDLRDIIKS